MQCPQPANGARQLMEPTDFAPVGRGAVIADPTGATVSLWQSANGDRPDAEPLPSGDFCWNELWTRDAKKALAFYEKTFGHAHDAMDMGEQGTYWILKSQDKGRAGIYEATDPKIPCSGTTSASACWTRHRRWPARSARWRCRRW